MNEILPWVTLLICAVAALARIPSALRGRNPSLFFVFLLATAASVLSIESFYLAIDRPLGGINVANVLLRLIAFATIFLVAVRVTKAFGATEAHRLISGRLGLAILAVFSVALVAVFLMMDASASSVSLRDVAAASPRNEALLRLYWAAARGYLAYVALALLPSLYRALASRLPVLVRTGAILMAAGALATVAGFLLEFAAANLNPQRLLVNNAAVVFFALGLASVWLARVLATRRRSHGTSSTER